MPPKKSAAATAKKVSESKIEKTAKTKTTKAEIPAKKEATKSTTPTMTNGVHTTTMRTKRKAEEVDVGKLTNGVKRHSITPVPAAKRPKTEASSKAVKKPAAAAKPKGGKVKAIINHAPTDRLNVYVFGEGSNGELGLGSAKGSLEVKRPRLNPLLSAEMVGVVQVAVGGMHTVVLTNNNRILTWGINDQSALGRDTAWDGGLKDVDADGDDSDSDDEIAVNPHESTPAEIDLTEVPEETIWSQVIASDSASFALTSDGLVYGWGTFRGNDGVIGFSSSVLIQPRPTLLKDLKKIVQLSCGANHVLALTSTGAVYAWGSGQQNQLGRRIIERMKLNGLTPSQFGLKGKKITTIGCGAYHSFAVDAAGKVYSWGLNSYGETGISKDIGDGDESDVHHPALVPELSTGTHGTVTHIEGGAHHSICVTDTGACLVWGRLDGYQLGIPVDDLPKENLIYDSAAKPRILTTPTPLPEVTDASYCAAGSDHSLAVGRDGSVYSWGFNATYQCGQGNDDDVEECTQIDNTAVRGKKIVWAGAGGQFSVVAGLADEEVTMVNGVH